MYLKNFLQNKNVDHIFDSYHRYRKWRLFQMNYISQVNVIDIINHKDDVNEYLVRVNNERKYSPGTFVQLTLDSVSASDIWPESRTFSIASYQKGIMRFIIKNVGYYTNRIFEELGVGSVCTVKYPFGDLFDKNLTDEHHILIASGVGITPFFSLIEYFQAIGKHDKVYLFYSAKFESDLLHYQELFDCLHDRLKVFITRENSENFINRRMQIADFEDLLIGGMSMNFYICGSSSFNQDISSKLKNKGYTKIHMDEWE
jgi:ferredoxin-NADP reductase